MPAKTYNYSRVNTKTDRAVTAEGATLFEVRQRVAWTVTDSLGGTRKEAVEQAGRIKGAGTYEVGDYRITVAEVGMCPLCGAGDLSEEKCPNARPSRPQCVYCCPCHYDDVAPGEPVGEPIFVTF